jgi:hypothetical protein
LSVGLEERAVRANGSLALAICRQELALSPS